MNLQAYHQQIAEYFQTKTQRERQILAYGVPLCLLFLLYRFMLSGFIENIHQTSLKVQKLQQEAQTLQRQEELLTKSYEDLKKQPPSQKVQLLNQQVQELSSQADIYSNRLSTAQKTVQVIKDLIQSSDQLQLLQLENKPPIREENLFKQSGALIWRHRIHLEILGTWSTFHQFLQQFELAQEYVSVIEVSLKTEEYPLLKGSLSIELLSLDKEVLGV
jgi:type II secretory pathway component PulM